MSKAWLVGAILQAVVFVGIVLIHVNDVSLKLSRSVGYLGLSESEYNTLFSLFLMGMSSVILAAVGMPLLFGKPRSEDISFLDMDVIASRRLGWFQVLSGATLFTTSLSSVLFFDQNVWVLDILCVAAGAYLAVSSWSLNALYLREHE